MKLGSRANIGDMVKIDVAIQGDAKEFNGIRYLEGPKLIESLKSSRGTDADA